MFYCNGRHAEPLFLKRQLGPWGGLIWHWLQQVKNNRLIQLSAVEVVKASVFYSVRLEVVSKSRLEFVSDLTAHFTSNTVCRVRGLKL